MKTDNNFASIFLCHGFDIRFTNEFQPGYYLRIEPIYSKTIEQKNEIKKNYSLANTNTLNVTKFAHKSFSKSKSKKSQFMKNSDIFQFKFNPTAFQYVGEMYENSNNYDNRIEENS